REILPYLERLRDEVPMVYVSHHAGELRRIATSVVRINAGHVAAVGGKELLDEGDAGAVEKMRPAACGGRGRSRPARRGTGGRRFNCDFVRSVRAAPSVRPQTQPLSSPRIPAFAGTGGPITTQVFGCRRPCHMALPRRMGPRLRGDDSGKELRRTEGEAITIRLHSLRDTPQIALEHLGIDSVRAHHGFDDGVRQDLGDGQLPFIPDAFLS